MRAHSIVVWQSGRACQHLTGSAMQVEPSPGPLPTHLFEPLVRSFCSDHYVEDEGDIVYYKKDPSIKPWFGFGKVYESSPSPPPSSA
jgi:hypothetical protein